jgi:hypothetical protein
MGEFQKRADEQLIGPGARRFVVANGGAFAGWVADHRPLKGMLPMVEAPKLSSLLLSRLRPLKVLRLRRFGRSGNRSLANRIG